jgi:hypothetical protein
MGKNEHVYKWCHDNLHSWYSHSYHGSWPLNFIESIEGRSQSTNRWIAFTGLLKWDFVSLTRYTSTMLHYSPMVGTLLQIQCYKLQQNNYSLIVHFTDVQYTWYEQPNYNQNSSAQQNG